jgi:hypothetical protein
MPTERPAAPFHRAGQPAQLAVVVGTSFIILFDENLRGLAEGGGRELLRSGGRECFHQLTSTVGSAGLKYRAFNEFFVDKNYSFSLFLENPEIVKSVILINKIEFN